MKQFLVVTDRDFVTQAIGLRFIVCVTLVDAGATTGYPLVDIDLANGDVIRSVMIPGPGGSSPPHSDPRRAVELFFDALAAPTFVQNRGPRG